MKRSGPPLTSEYSVLLGFSFNRRLGRNLDFLRNATLYQDFDAAILVDGKEGSGKSVLALQVATFLDKDRCLDIGRQVCFTPRDFKRAVTTLPAGKAIVWDEARRGVNRRRSMQDVNLDVTDMLAECRQNNLFMVIVLPSFYDMDMNVAVHRSRALIHVWYEWDVENVSRPLRRGFFRFYNEEAKTGLYTNKGLRLQYRYPFVSDGCFDATFPHHYPVDEKEYREKKKSAEAYWKGERVFDPEAVGFVLNKLKAAGVLNRKWRDLVGGVFGVHATTITNWMKKANTADTHIVRGEEEGVSSLEVSS